MSIDDYNTRCRDYSDYYFVANNRPYVGISAYAPLRTQPNKVYNVYMKYNVDDYACKDYITSYVDKNAWSFSKQNVQCIMTVQPPSSVTSSTSAPIINLMTVYPLPTESFSLTELSIPCANGVEASFDIMQLFPYSIGLSYTDINVWQHSYENNGGNNKAIVQYNKAATTNLVSSFSIPSCAEKKGFVASMTFTSLYNSSSNYTLTYFCRGEFNFSYINALVPTNYTMKSATLSNNIIVEGSGGDMK